MTGNGRDEVVFNTDAGLSIRDGLSGALLASLPSAGWAIAPTVADIDNDGDAEIIRLSGDVIEIIDETNQVWNGSAQGAWLSRNHAPDRLGALGASAGPMWFTGDTVRGNH